MWIDRMHDPSKRDKNPAFKIQDNTLICPSSKLMTIVFSCIFQTFRQYREMFEEQKGVIEQRYRSLLEDSIQDAVYLSTRNTELMDENASLKQGTISFSS